MRDTYRPGISVIIRRLVPPRFFVSPRAVGVCVVVLFVVYPLLQQYHTIHGTTHEVLSWL